MEMLAQELERFLAVVQHLPPIRTAEALAANEALHARFVRQRRWLMAVEGDRLEARRKMGQGEAAHEAWLAETYAVNPIE